MFGPDKDILGRRRYVGGKTKPNVEAMLCRKLAYIESGIVYDNENLTLGEYLDKWLGTVRDMIKSHTWTRHEKVVRLHLKPGLVW